MKLYTVNTNSAMPPIQPGDMVRFDGEETLYGVDYDGNMVELESTEAKYDPPTGWTMRVNYHDEAWRQEVLRRRGPEHLDYLLYMDEVKRRREARKRAAFFQRGAN